MDKAASETRGDRSRDTRAAEEVRDDHALVRACLDNALEQGFGLLGGVVRALLRLRIDCVNIRPHIIKSDAFSLIKIMLDAQFTCGGCIYLPLLFQSFYRCRRSCRSYLFIFEASPVFVYFRKSFLKIFI